MIVVSSGCPAGVGPQVCVAAAAKFMSRPLVLVGDWDTLLSAARLEGVAARRFVRFEGSQPPRGRIGVLTAGPKLGKRDCKPGSPSRRSGTAQLAYIEAAYELVRGRPGSAMVTGPVSKLAIARSGVRGAAAFRGHTEWLRRLDGAAGSTMCFVTPHFATSLVTTHLPLARVSRNIDRGSVEIAILALVQLLEQLGKRRRRIAVASVNPHAGEGELLGSEEQRAIVPALRAARRRLGKRAELVGPIGAETAFRLARAGEFTGVVAMYHDQATIPTKLLSFGDAVNVTMGLSIVRTSVDHGTGYDIAWRRGVDAAGMLAALKIGARLARATRRPSPRRG